MVHRRLVQLGHRFRPGVLAVGETPSRPANPATLLGNLLIAIEARDLPPASLGERVLHGKGLADRGLHPSAILNTALVKSHTTVTSRRGPMDRQSELSIIRAADAEQTLTSYSLPDFLAHSASGH
jgi:hypothetical protein